MNSEIRDICRKAYRIYVASAHVPEELRRSLKAHERVPVFMDNLAKELSKPGLKPTREEIERAATDMTRVFINAVHLKAEERLMSPLKIAMINRQKEIAKEMRETSERLEQEGTENVRHDTQGNETEEKQIRID